MSGERVLIVDDNPFNVKLASYVITSEGFDVRAVGSGSEMVATLASWPPKLILMDLRLRETDGLSLTGMLRANRANDRIVIVAFSAEAPQGHEQPAFQCRLRCLHHEAHRHHEVCQDCAATPRLTS